MTVHFVLLKELMIAGYEGSALLAAFERLTAALAAHGVSAPVVSAKPIKAANGLRPVAVQADAAAFSGAVAVTAPPENAKAIARKAILQSMLSPSTQALASHLIERFNLDTGRCDPGSVSLADDLGISVRQVRRSVASLVASGLFGKTRHGGRGFANAYQPNWSLMVERAAEGDIAAKRPMLSANAANVVTQNHLTKPDSDSMVVRPQRKRATAVVDRRQGYLPLPIAGGRDVSADAVRSKLTNQVNEFLKRLEKPQYVEGMTRLVSIDWAPAIAAEMRKAGTGLPLVLDAIASAAASRKAAG
ncbi:hypothetical protein [Devosia sp. 2618]|uniref:hypothetical protein n=1 Tax=Devosia sp. 2618 TaxID=3156454 RepID=UPI0033981A92